MRVGNHLEATPHAIQIKARLSLWLNDAEDFLQSEDFNPARCERTLTLAVTDYVAQFTSCSSQAHLPSGAAYRHPADQLGPSLL